MQHVIRGKQRKDDTGNPASPPGKLLPAPPSTAPPPTTVLLITVVPAVVDTIAHGPLRDAAVVCFTAEFCIVITAIGGAHWKDRREQSKNWSRGPARKPKTPFHSDHVINQADSVFLATVSLLCLVAQSCGWLSAAPWTVVHQASLSMEFSRQEYWSGLLFPTHIGNCKCDLKMSAFQCDEIITFTATR